MKKEKEILLKVADYGFRIKWNYPMMWNSCRKYYRGFLSRPDKVAAGSKLKHLTEVCVFWAKGKEAGEFLKGSRKIFSAPQGWMVYQNRQGYLMHIFHPDHKGSLALARISFDLEKIDYYLLDSDNRDSGMEGKKYPPFWLLPRLVQPCLRAVLLGLLAKDGGCFVHGAAINLNGKGLAFIGRSGSGKSTLAHLFGKYSTAKVLTDENIIITKEKNGYYIWGTPWPGGEEVAFSGQARLEKAFFIKHAKKNKLFKLSSGEALKKFFSQAALYGWGKDTDVAVFNFGQKLFRQVKVFEWGFTKNKSAVDFINKETLF